MILQALKEYYDRKAVDPDCGIAPLGWERKDFPFLVVIDDRGVFLRFEDTRCLIGKKHRAKPYVVPSLGEAKGNGIKANLLWENAEYMFGIPMRAESVPARVAEQHRAFGENLRFLAERSKSCGTLAAVIAFIEKLDVKKIQSDPLWQEVKELNQSLLLSVNGQGAVTEMSDVREAVNLAQATLLKGKKSLCMLSGGKDIMAILEPPIRGVQGASTMGAHLVAVNNKVSDGGNSGATPAFASFMKEQGANSPIGKMASLSYATALNTLLDKDSCQKIQIGDATTVFWSERRSDFEDHVCSFFHEPPKDNPDQLVDAVKSLYRSAESGAFVLDGDDTRFYVLGLSPNAARISVRFWNCGTIGEMAGRFRQHFDDLLLVHGPKDRDQVSLWRLLIATAVLGKSENIPPNLAGDMMRAILEGTPFPATLLPAILRRIKAEHEISHVRAALLKAIINRKARYTNANPKEEITVSLDTNNTNIGYRLGRLFAALEKIQADAQGSTNATIRDRFYGSASGTPATVFGTLMRLKNHHLAKLSDGLRIVRERLLGEIMDGVTDFPPHLSLEDQGRFAIGYYHQMQDFYTKKDKQG